MPNINNVSMNQQRNQRIGNLDRQKHQNTSAQHRISINAIRRANASSHNAPLSLGATFTSMMAVMTAGMVLGSIIPSASSAQAGSSSGRNESNQGGNGSLQTLNLHSEIANSTMPRITKPTPKVIIGSDPEASCGSTAPAIREHRNGKPVEKGSKVYAVHVEPRLFKFGMLDMGTCTGSALTKDTILTAAHCVSDVEEGPLVCKVDGKVIDLPQVTNRYAENLSAKNSATSPSAEDSSGVRNANVTLSHGDLITCTPSYRKFFYLPPENVTVHYGIERSKLNDTIYQVERIIGYPNYTMFTYQSSIDLALIKLKEPIEGISLVSLPAEQINTQLRRQIKANVNKTMIVHENNVYMQGWGSVANPNATTNSYQNYDPDNPPLIPTDRLMEGNRTTVNYLGKYECRSILCTVSKDKDACSGDSGGPIIFFDPNTSTPYVVGVNSLALEESGHYVSGVHADVFTHKEWIEETMQELDANNKRSQLKFQSKGKAEYVRLMLGAPAQCPIE